MKKAGLIKLTTLLIAIILCLGLTTPALAAGETDAVVTTAVAEAAAPSETPALPAPVDPIVTFKAEVIRLVNIEREKVGAAPVKELDTLFPMADVRAKESAASFSHTRPNNTRCFTIFGDNSMKYAAAGENLAYGFKTPEAVVAAWMKSEGHRRNILDPDFKFIGIGYFVNENGRIYCSQLFYTPKSK